MEQDHYAVLGISPTADQAAIRSAYRSLMRRYHPDADSSAEAAEQSRAINQAYSRLGDPAKRAAYDGSSPPNSPLRFEPIEPQKVEKGWGARIGAAGAVAVALVAVAMVAYAVLPRNNPSSVFDGERVVSRTASAEPGKAPSAAAQPDRQSKEMPKPIAVRPSDEVSETTDADALPVPARAELALPKAKANAAAIASSNAGVASPLSRPASAKCPEAARRADRLVCGDVNLASLDRQLSLLYRQSWTAADERKRAALLGTRQLFNDRLGECETSNCLTSAYVVRLKEISDIMAGRFQP